MIGAMERAGRPVRSFVVQWRCVAPAAVAVALGTVALLRMATSIDQSSSADADIFLWAVELAGALSAALIGAILVRRSYGSAPGWLLQLAAVGLATSALADSGAVAAGSWEAFGSWTAAVQLWGNLFGRVLLLAACVVALPDRVIASRPGSGAVSSVLAAVVVAVAAGLLLQGRPETLRATDVGFGNRAWVDAAASVPSWVFVVLLAVHSLVLISLAHRRGGEPTSFEVVGWALAVAVVPSAFPPIANRLPDALNDVLVTLALPVLPVVSLVAALRSIAWTVSRVLSRTIMWALLSLAVVILQGLALGVAAVAGGQLGLAVAVAVTVVVAVGFQATQRRLRSLLDRLLYGVERDPAAALADLGQRLQHAVGHDDLLVDVAGAIASAFGSGVVVALATADGPVDVARVGRFDEHGHEYSWPLVHQGEHVGQLAVRAPNDAPFRPADLAAIASLAPQAAVVAYTVRVTRQLRTSQETLTAAVEDERRRLQHDLHDGLGPALAGVALGLRAARNQLQNRNGDPDELLAVLTHELESCVEEVRRIVHGLRPAALDQLGLVAAIRAYADRCSTPSLRVLVEVDGDLAGLGAAVEVAAYRVAVEAMTNVVRHADASTCLVTIRSDRGGLQVEVVDDGVGVGASVTAGVGIESMRERVVGVGGRLLVAVGDDGGTRVVADLPTEARSA
jgi:signal transduction histidine kinase